MLDLIRKRHEGDGWLVFTELANRPGFHVKRFADAFALGVWASTKYEGHLYEEKISREDLKRELRDPDKANGVGKYAKYWWLCVSEEKLLEGLVIPDVWGILTPTVRGGSRIFKVVRQAPKLDPKPIDALFAMSMIRSGLKKMVSTADHQRVVEELDALKRGKRRPTTEDEIDLREQKYKLQHELDRLKQDIKSFQEASCVDISNAGYRSRVIGHAVRLVLEMQENGNALDQIGSYVAHLSGVAEQLENNAKTAAAGAVHLRRLLNMTEHTERCDRKKSWSGGRCSCGVDPVSTLEREIQRQTSAVFVSNAETDTPARADDDQGGGGDSGGAGTREQDAGVQLRD